MTPRQALEKYFGYTSFRPLQQDIVEDIINKKDVFVLMPTGGGKSICFQLPALLMEGTTIVVSPLISLMKDQIDSLTRNGIEAAFINSSQTQEQQQDVIQKLRATKLKLLYVAPERLTQPSFIDLLAKTPISFFAIDEAHCISQWGHDFRPEYSKLHLLKEQFPDIPVVAFTATATQRVIKDIVEQLAMENPMHYQASFDRENLQYGSVIRQKGYDQVFAYLNDHKDASGIIYCPTRKKVDDLTNVLTQNNISCLPYHAGLSDEDRHINQEKFIRDDVSLIVATVAFGMGIDKPNVRFIIHYGLPKNLEQYYQETGRAGRDGLPSDCLLLFSIADKVTIEHFFKEKVDPEELRIARTHLQSVIDYATGNTCRRKILLSYFGEVYPSDTCSNCDNCINPKETIDATIIAQKILSCVYRTGQRYGMHYISDILIGLDSLKVKERNHQSLSTFNILSEFSQPEVKHFMTELLQRGYLQTSNDGYATLSLTKKAIIALKQKSPIFLTKYIKKLKKAKKTMPQNLDTSLFERLRTLRKSIADKEHVPPYVIFSDVSLQEMAMYHPKNEDEFSKIKGVGQFKLEKYGAVFLKEISQ